MAKDLQGLIWRQKRKEKSVQYAKEIPAWIESRDNNDEDWQKASDELKKAVNICERLLKEGKVSV